MNGFVKSLACVFPSGSVFQVNGWTAATRAKHLSRSVGENALGSGLPAIDAKKEFHVALVAIEARRYASQCNPGRLLQQDNLAKPRQKDRIWGRRRDGELDASCYCKQHVTTSAWQP